MDVLPEYETKHGLGQVFRDFHIHKDRFTFLSRQGELINGKIHLSRMIDRVVLGSHLTDAIKNKTLTSEQYH